MKRIQRWLGRRAIEQQMREEMEFHLDSRIATLISQGLPPAEAARAARLEFGSTEAYREECRAALGYRPWDELRSDPASPPAASVTGPDTPPPRSRSSPSPSA